MPTYFFRSEPGAAELRRLSRCESGRVCQRVLMIANLLEGMEHEEAARLAGLSRSAAYEWHNRYEEEGIEGLRDRPRPGRQPRVDAVTSARFKERIGVNSAECTPADITNDNVLYHWERGLLNRNPLDLIETYLVAPSVAELRRARRRVVGHRGGLFERAAVPEIG